MSQNLAPGAPTFVAEVSVETMPPRFRVLAVLSALMGFASISTDLYLPAMPTMAGDLHADAGSMELTVSGFLIGFSLGQLLWGPLGDRYGRRLPVAGGLLLFILGSAGCPMSGTSTEMICWRILQAVGACSGVVLSRAMDRDLYQGSRAAKMLSTLITVMAVAPLLGPIIGGQVLAFAGWRAIFWLLVIVGVATLAALFTIPETLPVDRRRKDSILSALQGYGRLLVDRRLVGFTAVGGFFYAGVYAYIAGTPFAFIDYYHVAPQLYGLLFALGIVGIMLANVFNARFVDRFGSRGLLHFDGRGTLRRRPRCDRLHGMGPSGGAGDPALRLRLMLWPHRRQFHQWSHAEFSRKSGIGIRACRLSPIWIRNPWIGGSQCLCERNAVTPRHRRRGRGFRKCRKPGLLATLQRLTNLEYCFNLDNRSASMSGAHE
jgi:DHA1 family bicyclomycin/chloramphenicol resistance-like MFS transporter